MNTDLITAKEQWLHVGKTNDSCIVDFTERVPFTSDTGGSHTTKCVIGGWSAEVKQVNLAVLKQEPDDVCCVLYYPTYSVYHNRVNLYSSLITV